MRGFEHVFHRCGQLRNSAEFLLVIHCLFKQQISIDEGRGESSERKTSLKYRFSTSFISYWGFIFGGGMWLEIFRLISLFGTIFNTFIIYFNISSSSNTIDAVMLGYACIHYLILHSINTIFLFEWVCYYNWINQYFYWKFET